MLRAHNAVRLLILDKNVLETIERMETETQLHSSLLEVPGDFIRTAYVTPLEKLSR